MICLEKVVQRYFFRLHDTKVNKNKEYKDPDAGVTG